MLIVKILTVLQLFIAVILILSVVLHKTTANFFSSAASAKKIVAPSSDPASKIIKWLAIGFLANCFILAKLSFSEHGSRQSITERIIEEKTSDLPTALTEKQKK